VEANDVQSVQSRPVSHHPGRGIPRDSLHEISAYREVVEPEWLTRPLSEAEDEQVSGLRTLLAR